MTSESAVLYELLPAVYRELDAEKGYPLRGSSRIIAEQARPARDTTSRGSGTTSSSRPRRRGWCRTSARSSGTTSSTTRAGSRAATAEALFDDLAGTDLRPAVAVPDAADVAKTIYYRRRKGTLPMLEELARDVTGWPAHAVEFFQLLGWTQNVEHIPRRRRLGRPPLARSATSVSTVPSTRRPHGRRPRRSRRSKAGTASTTSASSCGGCARTRSTGAGAPRTTAPGASTFEPARKRRAALHALAPGGRRDGPRDRAPRPGPDPARTFYAGSRGRRAACTASGAITEASLRPRPANGPRRCRAPADPLPPARPLAVRPPARHGGRRRRRRSAGSPSAPASATTDTPTPSFTLRLPRRPRRRRLRPASPGSSNREPRLEVAESARTTRRRSLRQRPGRALPTGPRRPSAARRRS